MPGTDCKQVEFAALDGQRRDKSMIDAVDAGIGVINPPAIVADILDAMYRHSFAVLKKIMPCNHHAGIECIQYPDDFLLGLFFIPCSQAAIPERTLAVI